MNDDNDINKMKTFITIISFGSSVNIYIYNIFFRYSLA